MQPDNPANHIYTAVPLSNLSLYARSHVLEAWARSLDKNATDAKRTVRADGKWRSAFQTEYDFLSGDIRVEVKSASLTWDITHKRFVLKFWHVKNNNDEIRLVSYTPSGLFLHRWNGKFKNSQGLRREAHGFGIVIRASVRNLDWLRASEEIMNKNFGELLNFTSWDQYEFDMLLQHSQPNQYEGLPLSDLSPAFRGNILEKWVRSLDNDTVDPEKFLCRNGRIIGTHSAPYDYQRKGVRVEVKSSKMMFDKTTCSWRFKFTNIRQTDFDELRLVFYTPGGIYVFVHNGTYGVGKTGKLNSMQVSVLGPQNVADWQSSWKAISKKNFGHLIIKCDF